MSDIKLLIVDDSVTIRAMFEELAQKQPGLEIVGVAASAEEALELVNRQLPDLVALDIGLPGMDGFAFLDQVRNHWHAMQIIVVSSSVKHDAPICQDAFEHGAVACFDKAQLIKESGNLFKLMVALGRGKLRQNTCRGEAITLPTNG